MLVTKTVAIDQIVLGNLIRKSDTSPSNPDQIRVRENMSDYGLLCPLGTIMCTEVGKYFLRDGLRRLEAAKQLGWKEIDIVYTDGEVYKP